MRVPVRTLQGTRELTYFSVRVLSANIKPRTSFGGGPSLQRSSSPASLRRAHAPKDYALSTAPRECPPRRSSLCPCPGNGLHGAVRGWYGCCWCSVLDRVNCSSRHRERTARCVQRVAMLTHLLPRSGAVQLEPLDVPDFPQCQVVWWVKARFYYFLSSLLP